MDERTHALVGMLVYGLVVVIGLLLLVRATGP